MLDVGVVFATTGGNKILRAVRSFRRAEPDTPVHVVVDITSNTWRNGGQHALTPLLDLASVRCVENHAHINGTLNRAMEWMAELGHTHACLFHDDIVFSPLPEHLHHISRWFSDAAVERAYSALTLSHMEAFVPHDGTVKGQPGNWHESESWWDARDLESESLWRVLCPNGQPAGYFGGEGPDGGPIGEVDFGDWFVHCTGAYRTHGCLRLGPAGQIVSIDAWQRIGKFDESKGLIYDMVFAVECAMRRMAPVLIVPNIPFLHLHNQSIGFKDPAFSVWNDVTGAFNNHYGWTIGEFWKEQGFPVT
jgi:hypothetical protein